jgi:DNA primase
VIAGVTIEEVKRRVSLLEQVEKARTVTRSGRLYKCLCPFHHETSPSFCIYPESNSYYCFGCQAAGNVISYVMQTEGLGFPEAVERLAQQAGVEIERTQADSRRNRTPEVPFELLYRVNVFAQRVFEHGLTRAPEHVLWYLKKRLGSLEFGKEFGIGYAASGVFLEALRSKGVDPELGCLAGLLKKSERGRHYEYFRDRVVFPIYSGKDKIIGFGGRIVPGAEPANGRGGPKYLNSPETSLYKKNSSLYHSLVALEAIRQSGEVFVVEGYFDVISLHRWGVKNVVATCGTAFTEEHARRLSRLAKRICLLFDGDEAGYNAAAKSVKLVGICDADIKVIFLPAGEDPDSFAMKAQGELVSRLGSLKREDIFDVFIRREIQSFGGEGTRLSPAVKTRIVQQIAPFFDGVTVGSVYNQIVEMIGFRLGISSDVVRQMMIEGRNKASVHGTYNPPPSVGNTSGSVKGSDTLLTQEALSGLDRMVILGLLVSAREFTSSYFSEEAVMTTISPAALQIAGMLVVSAHESDRDFTVEDVVNAFRFFFPDQVRIVDNSISSRGTMGQGRGHLQRLIPTEVYVTELIRECRELKAKGAGQVESVVYECKSAISRAHLERLSQLLEVRIRESGDEQEQRELVQEHLLVRRKLSGLGRRAS